MTQCDAAGKVSVRHFMCSREEWSNGIKPWVIHETFHVPGALTVMYQDMDFDGQFFTLDIGHYLVIIW